MGSEFHLRIYLFSMANSSLRTRNASFFAPAAASLAVTGPQTPIFNMFKSQLGSAFTRLFALLALVLCFSGLAHAQQQQSLTLTAQPPALEGADATFRVTLSSPATQRLTFRFDTFGGGGPTGAREAPSGAFDADYDGVSTNGDYTLEVGETQLIIRVPTNQDTSYEFDEDFNAFISNPRFNGRFAGNVTTNSSSVTQLILNDDAPPDITLSQPDPILEGDSLNRQRQNYNFTVNIGSTLLDPNREVLGRPITLAFTTTDGTATSNGVNPGQQDFVPVSSDVVTVPAGTRQFQYTVIVLGDDVYETDENFRLSVTYSPPVPGIRPSTTTGIIRDNDLPTYRIDPADPAASTTVEEGNPVVFVIRLVDRQGNEVLALNPITFNYSVQNVTATLGQDFTDPNNGSFTIPRNQSQFTLSFPTIDDNAIEQTETFRFVVRDAVGTRAPEGNNTNVGVGTILDTADNSAGTVLTIQNETVVEGTGGLNEIQFTVNLSRSTGQPVTLSYQTVDSTDRNPDARATSNVDYTATTGRLTFSPGQTMATFAVPITTDAINELDETFRVRLFNPTNANFANNAEAIFATGTIIDDDDAGVISVARTNVDVAENVASGVVNVVVNFTPTAGSRQVSPVTVDFTTVSDTAQQEGRRDYFGTSGTLTFRPGATRVVQQVIPIRLFNDGIYEGDESFSVRLSNPTGATLSDQLETSVTIKDDDALPVISAVPAGIFKEASGTQNFVVAIKGKSQAPITVNYTFVDGTATYGQDYVALNADGEDARNGSVTFTLGGPNFINVPVNILQDNIDEINETFSLSLSQTEGDNGFSLPANTATSTAIIFDDDDTPELTIGDTQIVEGNPVADQAANELVFPVTLNRPSSRPVTFSYITLNQRKTDCIPANGCDVATNQDYVVARNIVVTIAPGVLTAEIRVSVKPDILNEFNEQFTVNARELVNAVPSAYKDAGNGRQRIGTTAYGTILNDDAGGVITISGPTDNAGNAITSINEGYRRARGRRLGGIVNFVVTLPAPTGRNLTVNYALRSSVADDKDVADLTSNPGRGQITFFKGQTTRTITYLARSDNLAEGPELLNVFLSLADNNGANSYRTNRASSSVTIIDNTPQVTSVTPTIGFPKYGTVAATQVTISGSQLRTAGDPRVSAVLFNGVAANGDSIQYVSDDVLTVSVPDNATSGPLSLLLVDRTIVSTLGLTPRQDDVAARPLPRFVVQPVILSFTPTAGVVRASTLTIVGSIFSDDNNPVTAVQFSNGARVPVAEEQIIRNRAIQITVPANASNGPLRIVTRDGGVGPASLDSFTVVNATSGSITLGDNPDRNAIVEGSTGTFSQPVRNFNGTGDNAFHRPYQFFLNPARQSGGANDGAAIAVTPLTVRFQITSSTGGGNTPLIAVRADVNGNGRAVIFNSTPDSNDSKISSVNVDLSERFDPATPLEVAIIDAGTDNLPPIIGGTPANVTVTAQIVNSTNTTFFPNTPANQVPTIRVDRVQLADGNQAAIAFGANTRASFSVPFSQGNTDSVAISDVFNTPPMVGTKRRYTILRLNVTGQTNSLESTDTGEGVDFVQVDDNGRLERGIGYRLIVANNTTVQLKTKDAALVVPNDQTFSFSLTRNVALSATTNGQGNSTNGYNFIGFPFDPARVQSVDISQATVTFNGVERSFSDAVSSGLINAQLFTLDGNGQLVPANTTTIKPFQAYFVQIFRDNLTLTLNKPTS